MKVTMQPAISLDGFIARLDGDSETWVNPADEARYQAVVEKCGNVLVGRTTYEQYKADFGDYGDVLVFVVTGNEEYKDSEKVKYIHGSAEEIIKHISDTYGLEELIVCGGGEINGMLAAANLVTDIVVSLQPVVLGGGIPLFGTYKPNLQLELVSVNQGIPGVIQNHYRMV